MVYLTGVTPMPLLSNIKITQGVVMIMSTLFLCDSITIPTTLLLLFVLSSSKYMHLYYAKTCLFFSSAER